MFLSLKNTLLAVGKQAAVFLCLASFLLLLAAPCGSYLKAGRLRETNKLQAALLYSELGGFLRADEKADICFLDLGLEALAREKYHVALAYLAYMQTPPLTEQFNIAVYAKALAVAKTHDYDNALLLLGALGGFGDSTAQYQNTCYTAGTWYMANGVFAEAHRYYSITSAQLYPDAAGLAQQCVELGYNELVAEYQETKRVPAGFSALYLYGYKDTAKYNKLAYLQKSDWSDEDFEKNLAMLYELGEFENMASYGFAAERVMEYRWSGDGRYLKIDWFGNVDSNLPQYRLAGYYGLYIKIADGIMYIGSDEKKWTKQFGFVFLDFDKTLTVYCYYSGETFTLHKET
jgi:hypothetical protein